MIDDAAGARRDLPEATTLPGRFYTDPAVYAAERELIFARQWCSVARVEDVAEPGDYVTFILAGEPIVVVRDRDGDLHALANVCRHRNATVVEGAGNAKALQCPYHLWTYRLDGQLAHAPGMDGATGFDPEEICLPALGVETWQGWVFVNLDPAADPLGPRLTGLDAICEPYDLAAMRRVGTLDYHCEWNWKVIVENFAESYHHAGVHPTILEPTFPGSRSWAVDKGGQPWSSLDHETLVPEYEPFTASLAYPNHAFSITRPNGLVWFRMQINDVENVDLQLQLFLSPEHADDGETASMILDGLRAINDEDMTVNRRVQQGLRSRFAQPGRISPLEQATWEFRRWLLDQLSSP